MVFTTPRPRPRPPAVQQYQLVGQMQLNVAATDSTGRRLRLLPGAIVNCGEVLPVVFNHNRSDPAGAMGMLRECKTWQGPALQFVSALDQSNPQHAKLIDAVRSQRTNGFSIGGDWRLDGIDITWYRAEEITVSTRPHRPYFVSSLELRPL